MNTLFPSDFRRLRRLPALGALALALTFVGPADAAQTVAIGEVEVEASGEAAYVEAMRAALVRITGRRSAANDPAFASLLQDARRYAQIVRPPSAGNPARITLDVAAIERVVSSLGQSVWSRERPLVLGVVSAAPPGADPATVRAELERAATARGLPLRLSPAAAVGLAPGAAVSAESALLAARQAGADAALIGEADGGEWQWTLFDGMAVTVFHGDAAVGVEGAADTLALGSLAAAAQPLGETEFQVRGVRSLKDYADVQKLLVASPAIKSAELIVADGDDAWFRVVVSGGASGLAEALATQPRLKRESGGGDAPRYRYGP